MRASPSYVHGTGNLPLLAETVGSCFDLVALEVERSCKSRSDLRIVFHNEDSHAVSMAVSCVHAGTLWASCMSKLRAR